MKKALVFTMHKVGSSSIMHALRSIGRNPGRGFEENLEELKPLDQWEKVITLVRDPVERNISYFFERWDRHLGIRPHLYEGDLMEKFWTTFDHDYPLTFFDEVFNPAFGIDVYDRPFPKRQWQIRGDILIIRTDKIESQLPQAFRELFGLPKGTEVAAEHRAKTETQRPYGEFYKEFVRKTKFDADYLKRMYTSKFVKHFFTEEEIYKMIMRWING